MKRADRVVLGVIVGAAAVLGVVALGRTADLGVADAPSTPTSTQTTATTPTVPVGALDPAAARRALQAARDDLARAKAEAKRASAPVSVPTPAPRTVTVPAVAPTYMVDEHEYGDDDHGYGDDDHGGDEQHGDGEDD